MTTISYRKGKCTMCEYPPLSEAEYMRPYCICQEKVINHKDKKFLSASYMCPLCGKNTFHTHTPTEIIIFNNGRKYAKHSTSKNRK